MAVAGDAASASATVSVRTPTRNVLASGPITLLRISRLYFLTTISPTIPAFS
jgi:hypothetical protein